MLWFETVIWIKIHKIDNDKKCWSFRHVTLTENGVAKMLILHFRPKNVFMGTPKTSQLRRHESSISKLNNSFLGGFLFELFNFYNWPGNIGEVQQRKTKAKLQPDQNKAAHFALNCTHRPNITNMHNSLSWLRVDEKLTTSLAETFLCWKCLTTCIIYLHTLQTDIDTPPDTPLWVSSLYPNQKQV